MPEVPFQWAKHIPVGGGGLAGLGSPFFSPAQPKTGDRFSRTLWNLQAGLGLAVGPEANGVISLGLVSSSVKWHSSLRFICGCDS